jgi:histidinol-phosphate/aromatic aminotransferase/cobyric acid decarboxylase-like protein
VGSSQSLEPFAAASSNVIVCKSMSKVYALSGARAAYLVGPPALIAELAPRTPPWAVSLPAQIAACAALGATEYYAARWRETGVLRQELQRGLEALGWTVTPGCANFLLCQLPPRGPDAGTIVGMARERGLFVRDVGNMGCALGTHAVRLAVKDRATNARMLDILAEIASAGAERALVTAAPARC